MHEQVYDSGAMAKFEQLLNTLIQPLSSSLHLPSEISMPGALCKLRQSTNELFIITTYECEGGFCPSSHSAHSSEKSTETESQIYLHILNLNNINEITDKTLTQTKAKLEKLYNSLSPSSKPKTKKSKRKKKPDFRIEEDLDNDSNSLHKIEESEGESGSQYEMHSENAYDNEKDNENDNENGSMSEEEKEVKEREEEVCFKKGSDERDDVDTFYRRYRIKLSSNRLDGRSQSKQSDKIQDYEFQFILNDVHKLTQELHDEINNFIPTQILLSNSHFILNNSKMVIGNYEII
jgi:hypothetical protein